MNYNVHLLVLRPLRLLFRERRERLSDCVFYHLQHQLSFRITRKCIVVSLPVFFNLLIATLKALQIIHEKNIMHGDVKASNIFAWKDTGCQLIQKC